MHLSYLHLSYNVPEICFLLKLKKIYKYLIKLIRLYCIKIIDVEIYNAITYILVHE